MYYKTPEARAKHNAYNKAWSLKNPDRHKATRRAISKRFYAKPANKLKKQEEEKKYNLSPAGVYKGLKWRKPPLELLSKEDFISWYQKQDQHCYYCKRTVKEVHFTNSKFDKLHNRLSVDRKNNYHGYILDNMVLACMRCNAIKSDYFSEEEMLLIGHLIYLKHARSQATKNGSDSCPNRT